MSDSQKENEVESIISCSTSAGDFSLKLNRAWSPNGYDRAVELFERGFFDNSHFYRVVPNFLVQFGISYSTDQDLQHFANTQIKDDPPMQPRMKFKEGFVSFAGSGENSRTSQLFISYGAIGSLGTQKWETPIGTVIDGMEIIQNLNHEYGDMPPWGHGPKQHLIRQGGAAYIETHFPHLDKFIECKVSSRKEDNEIEKADVGPRLAKEKEVQVNPIDADENTEQASGENHVDILMPITAAFLCFAILTYLMKKNRRKITGKSS